MTDPIAPPRRKDPLEKTREPLAPSRARSRAAHLFTLAAAEGRFLLPTCVACGKPHYPAREICPFCLALEIEPREQSGGGTLAAATTLHTSTDPYFRERLPWRLGTVVLDCGPSVVAHVHGDVAEGRRVTLAWKLDKSGQAVGIALPPAPTAHMSDDPHLRELTMEPKFRRVLVTDVRSAVGQAMVAALAKADAAIVFAGLAEAWKPFPGRDALARSAKVEIVPLDLTDTESVTDLASSIGAKVDILINTADHIRPGGLVDGPDLIVQRETMEAGYLGLARLARAFGPIMRARGADGTNSAAAWVNILSVYAHMSWPAYGAHAAAQAAILSGAQTLRAELRPGGVRVVNVFTGPLDTEWFQTVPPPKVGPATVASAVVEALRSGQEDVYVGDVARDIRARLAANAKALEREIGE